MAIRLPPMPGVLRPDGLAPADRHLPPVAWWDRADANRWAPRVPRRVVLFTETFLPRVDGIVNTLCWTLRGLVEAGCEPLVVAPRGNTALLPGVQVIGASSMPLPLYPEVRLALMGPGIGRQLDEFKP